MIKYRKPKKGYKHMALIKCPECNKEVSDKSEVCIHCGYPIKEYIDICCKMLSYYVIIKIQFEDEGDD